MKFSLFLSAFYAIVLAFGSSAYAQAPAKKSAANLVPDATTVYLELTNVEQLIETIFDHPLRSKIEALAPYQQAIESPTVQTGDAGLTDASKTWSVCRGVKRSPRLLLMALLSQLTSMTNLWR